MTMDNKLKSLATQTCVDAITSASVNLVDEVATKLALLYSEQRPNTPMKFSKTDADRIAFDARVAFNKLKGVAYPKAIKYDHGKDGGFSSFRARHLELTKIVENVQHYAEAKDTCDALVKVGTFKQAGASEIVRAMAAIGRGTSADTFKTEAIDKASKNADEKTQATAKAITAEGFNDQLDALIEKAGEHRIAISPNAEGFYRFIALPPEKTLENVIDDMPDSEPEVMDGDAIAKMMDTTFYQNAGQADKAAMMAAFVRR